ncbi:MAG: ATP-binding protein, partial [Blastocatellia bacterium]|nr:ATP-binding protein [Blastocatellia bacterium]
MTSPPTTDALKFRVASHVVEDFGLNLYTSLPRVLVEFVANAHDADAEKASIKVDDEAIAAERKVMRLAFELEKAEAAKNKMPPDSVMPLKDRVLPDNLSISIEDTGHGMSRSDLRDKFLIAGRRRRLDEKRLRTDNGRIIMGRKGLGKLAGFGVAHRVQVTSRKDGEKHATMVTLDYDELVRHRLVDEMDVPEELISDGGGLPETGGTRIVLSRLVYEAMKSRSATIANEIADHFSSILPEEFEVKYNGKIIEPSMRELYWAWPNPELPVRGMVDKTLLTEDGDSMPFKYRIRFTPRKQSLPASERGVRVYAHRRLAATPSLLEVRTGIHGFRNTEYLDGVVEADFIDEDVRTDYIATDRQSLRWEVAQLGKLKEFLSTEMTTACAEFQKVIDKDNEESTKKDVFTQSLLDKSNLPKHRRQVANRVAALLAGTYAGNVEGKEYRTQLEIFVNGLSQGDILGALRKLAQIPNPKFPEVVERITELTEREIADFMKYVEGRLEGIEALRKLYTSADFKKAKNEDELHLLFERNPWLLDTSFSQY